MVCTKQVMITREDWDDFRAVAREYGLDFVYVEVDEVYMILNDIDIAGDILWAFVIINRSEDTRIAKNETVLFGAGNT